MEIIKLIALFAGVALFALMYVLIFRLQKQVNDSKKEALKKAIDELKNNDTIFRISGKDLVWRYEKNIPKTTPEQRHSVYKP